MSNETQVGKDSGQGAVDKRQWAEKDETEKQGIL